ncbi:LytR/AlgR family response regulator transcription factor [Mucilaginibacter paludis]|uniref:Response regulator receiver protein n=1 Tax=Mucilaginibacter paludis DSM 18603 TaxID=714943 RepID=H1YIZ1_9SPHI|nr:LytTR family DNA-binding domain-containing protein [Mucilaginibacter paludis]EHQ27686.1 response regulator receiver protein [Mucilaginibacter paludis DSM 18603]
MRIYLNQEHLLNEIEYPRRYRSENLTKTAAVIWGAVLLFLLLFKPFGVYEPEQKMNYFLICCFHASSPAIITYAYFGTLNYLKEKRKLFRKWTLLREYGHIGFVLLLTGTSSFLMRDLIYRNEDNWSVRYLWEEIRNCFVAGTLFYVLLRLGDFYFQSQKGSPFVVQFIPLDSEPVKEDQPQKLFIKTQVKQDDFSLYLKDLLFVKADGNYIELTTCKDGLVNNELKRISLTQFEAQLAAYPYFLRCHRAYLVNMRHVEKVSGNSQGYLLTLGTAEAKVPVSRTQLDIFNTRYQQLKQVYSI